MLDAIDDATAVVAFSHVLFRTSYIMDAAPIVERARAVGAAVILDTYQSAGIMPVDVTALGVDFAVGGCLKWLCGGPGNAFLYTRPDVLKNGAAARSPAGCAARRPFAFDIDADATRDDAMRMMNGTPSIPAYYAALAGLEIINEVGVDRIREQSKRMTGTAAGAGRSSTASRRRRRAIPSGSPAPSPSTCPTRCTSPGRSRRATSSSTTGRRSASASRRTSTTRSTKSIGSWRRWRPSSRRRTTRRATRGRW